MAFFSVIISLYNKENEILKTLSSVFHQTFNDYEIIIVNDGSTDNSLSKVSSLNNENITVFSTENKGVSSARNTGIKNSKGKYIAFLDADDIWKQNHLEELFKLINKFNEKHFFCTSYEKKISEKLITKPNFYNINKNHFGIVDDFFKHSIKDCIAWTSSVCISKNILLNKFMFDENITHGEDTDLWIRLALNYDVVFSNKITSQYNLTSYHSSINVNITDRKYLNFDKFTNVENTNKSLKKYLDLNRFYISILYKSENQLYEFKKLSKNINRKNLTLKQRILLYLNPKTLKFLKKIKFKFQELKTL